MPIAQQRFNMRYHFAEMIRNWSGKECTHRKITETIDANGLVIDRAEVDTTIYAIVGNPPFNEKIPQIGNLKTGTLCMYYWYTGTDADILVSKQVTETTTRNDQVIFQGMTYKVEQLDEIAYDLNVAGDDHEPIFAKYTLKRFAA